MVDSGADSRGCGLAVWGYALGVARLDPEPSQRKLDVRCYDYLPLAPSPDSPAEIQREIEQSNNQAEKLRLDRGKKAVR